jgi:hypothetical protein
MPFPANFSDRYKQSGQWAAFFMRIEIILRYQTDALLHPRYKKSAKKIFALSTVLREGIL